MFIGFDVGTKGAVLSMFNASKHECKAINTTFYYPIWRCLVERRGSITVLQMPRKDRYRDGRHRLPLKGLIAGM